MPDPISAGLGALQAIGGGLQAIIGGGKAKRYRRELEQLQTPTTTSSAAISNYYDQARANAFDSPFYKLQKEQIDRNSASALSTLNSRRSGLLGAASILRAQNDAYARAGATADQQQRGMLANAVRMKAGDDERVFQQNKMLPFQKKYSILSSQLAGAQQTVNAGLQNIFGGLGGAAAGAMIGDGSLGSLFGGRAGMASAPYESPRAMAYSSPNNLKTVW